LELDRDFKRNWPIQQGDVFGFWDWRSRPPLNRFGLIVTADCDIENGQPDQELVYLRIVAQSDYVDIFWSRSKLLGAREQALRGLVPQINRLRRGIDPDAEPLQTAEVLSWIVSSTPDDIVDAIQVSDENERTRLMRNLAQAKRIAEFANAPIGSSCFARLLELKQQQRPAAMTQAANDLRSNRDEVFFITAITEPDDTSGYYVLLDQIGAIRRDTISDSVEAVRRGDKAAYRFGTLSKTYKYAVAQSFAFLFQKIGLPNDHRDRRNAALARMNETDIQIEGGR
jgi:hypothetical protein